MGQRFSRSYRCCPSKRTRLPIGYVSEMLLRLDTLKDL